MEDNTTDKAKDKINKAINELVYEKVSLRKAYNYYHGYRDPEQYRHIESNYGIGTPTSLTFTPLIKKHIDVLIGEYLGLNQSVKISCKDDKTISSIFREKQMEINKSLFNFMKQKLQNEIISIIVNSKEPTNDPYIENQLNNIKKDIEDGFISDYEIAAQNIINYFRQSRNIDLKNKMKDLFLDLLISGTSYYRVSPSENRTAIELEVLNPLNTFVEKNPNSHYLKDCRRCVIRKSMTLEDVINKYRSELSDDAIEVLKNNENKHDKHTNNVYVRVPIGSEMTGNTQAGTGILGGLEVHPVMPLDSSVNESYYRDFITVYEVEWIEADIETGYLTRHEGVKIGTDIYLIRGESDTVTRTQDNPSKCTLSVNGMFFSDNNGSPFSLMISTMDLQDKYDLLTFYRDNIIASSGTVGDWIDLAVIPEALGVEFTDRIQKWIAYKKNGLAMYDSSQEGSNMVNTSFNGFDDTVKAQSIQAIQIAIQSIEQQASGITGVLPERLAQYEQRDAVSNVQLGVKMSGMLTKSYFEVMDVIFKEVNYDLLNLSKIIYPNGMKSTIILGDKYSRVFESLPEHYTVTDYDIHIEDSTETYRDRETIKALSSELVKAGQADPEMIVNIVSAKNMTELKSYINKSTKEKKDENGMIQQMQQQLSQYEQQVKEYEKEFTSAKSQIDKLTKEVDKNNSEKIKLEYMKINLEKQRIENQDKFNDKSIEVKEKHLAVEINQMYDDNPYNDKIES